MIGAAYDPPTNLAASGANNDHILSTPTWRRCEAIRKLRISHGEDQVAVLPSAVESGEYATTSDIIREAVQDWQIKRSLQQQEAAWLRDLWDRGKASGEPAPLEVDRVRTEAHEKLRQAVARADGD